MIEILMCITLVCFDSNRDWKYWEVHEGRSFTVYEKDFELDVLSFENYDRYRAKYNWKSWWRACYPEEDATKRFDF